MDAEPKQTPVLWGSILHLANAVIAVGIILGLTLNWFYGLLPIYVSQVLPRTKKASAKISAHS